MAHDLRLISRVRVNVFMFLSFGGKPGPRRARPIIRSRPMTHLFGVQIPTTPWLVVASIIGVMVVCAFVMSSVALWLIRRIVQRMPMVIDDRICQLLERYLFPILTIGGLLLFVDTVPLPAKALHLVDKLLVLLGLLLTFFL